MSLSPFGLLYGSRQGRVAPVGWTPQAGNFVYVLGSDVPGLRLKLAAGDYHQIAQTGDITAASFVRVSARLRGAALPTQGLAWRFSMLVDASEATARVLEPTRTVDRFDLAANVSKLSGDHEIAFRLALTGPAGAYEVELPGVYIDAVLLDGGAARPALVNRIPERGEIAVPLDTTISLELLDVGSDGIDQAATQIYVNDALAFHSTFQPNFAGPRHALAFPSADTLGITLDPVAPFPSGEDVTVRVVSTTLGAAGQLDATYVFTVADVASPKIIEAYAPGEKQIRLLFDETLAETTALDPARYSLALVEGAPAVTPAITEATSAAGNVVALTTDIEMTPDATYRVTAIGVEDLAGNPIAAPGNTATFAGYRGQEPEGRDFSIWSWLPELNRREDETGDLRKFVGCMQEVTHLMLDKIDRFVDILDPDFAPEDWLDLMLTDLGNPFPFSLDLMEKRRLAQLLVSIYKRKGTDRGIVDAIRLFLGIEVTISVYAWSPHPLGQAAVGQTLAFGASALRHKLTFLVHLTEYLTAEQRKRIRWLVNYMKDARTHFRLIEPAPLQGLVDHWMVGFSAIGINAKLH